MDSRFILIYFPFRGTRVGASNKQCEFHQIKIVSQVHVLQRCGYGRFLHRRDKLCSRPGTEYEFISPTLWDRQKGLTKSMKNKIKNMVLSNFIPYTRIATECLKIVFFKYKIIFSKCGIKLHLWWSICFSV